jgi:hypothetical protein
MVCGPVVRQHWHARLRLSPSLEVGELSRLGVHVRSIEARERQQHADRLWVGLSVYGVRSCHGSRYASVEDVIPYVATRTMNESPTEAAQEKQRGAAEARIEKRRPGREPMIQSYQHHLKNNLH